MILRILIFLRSVKVKIQVGLSTQNFPYVFKSGAGRKYGVCGSRATIVEGSILNKSQNEFLSEQT